MRVQEQEHELTENVGVNYTTALESGYRAYDLTE